MASAACVGDALQQEVAAFSRAEAIADGRLMDVSEMASDVGFRFPVCLTSRTWWAVIEPTQRARRLGQSSEARLWELLWAVRCALLRRVCLERAAITFRVQLSEGEGRARTVTLRAVCAPGDDSRPTLTVMMPDEEPGTF
jgi:ABC-type uncharacterized transport system YnjBCD permease subunit